MRDHWPRDDYERRVDDYWDYRDRIDTYWDHRHRDIDDEWRRIDLKRANERLRTYSPESLLAGDGVSVDSPDQAFEAEDVSTDTSPRVYEPVEEQASTEPETPSPLDGLFRSPTSPLWSSNDRVRTGLQALDQWCQHPWLPNDRFEQHKVWIRADVESSTFDPDVKRELIEQVDALEYSVFSAVVSMHVRRLLDKVTALTADSGPSPQNR